ncbi:TIGR03618 family F420-dependent PPOX class oxidoreductase [Mycobacterium sp. 852013-50091_SCH5140682]|uniref:TIGR03618 family F420-dependent PPOX class oxidoreductase n=1 Tax=Mycobacterium sp. 852013-50091_SCH5140682 TaxID=1834109 RepID=UPI0009EE3293|nr:TIGR03618 family F420-dependent PPOX class oxidoreductase [Mycobacterium sp. 852013-50091_SCH5140682]
MEIGKIIPVGEENQQEIGDRRAGGIADLPDSHLRLLRGAYTAAMSTVNASGSVQLTPVWLMDDGEHLLFNTARGRHKARNLAARPHVSFLIVDPKDPFVWVSLQGQVVRVVDEDDVESGHLATETINRAAALYLGVDVYPNRDDRGEVRRLYYIRPDRVVVMG